LLLTDPITNAAEANREMPQSVRRMWAEDWNRDSFCLAPLRRGVNRN